MHRQPGLWSLKAIIDFWSILLRSRFSSLFAVGRPSHSSSASLARRAVLPWQIPARIISATVTMETLGLGSSRIAHRRDAMVRSVLFSNDPVVNNVWTASRDVTLSGWLGSFEIHCSIITNNIYAHNDWKIERIIVVLVSAFIQTFSERHITFYVYHGKNYFKA